MLDFVLEPAEEVQTAGGEHDELLLAEMPITAQNFVINTCLKEESLPSLACLLVVPIVHYSRARACGGMTS